MPRGGQWNAVGTGFVGAERAEDRGKGRGDRVNWVEVRTEGKSETDRRSGGKNKGESAKWEEWVEVRTEGKGKIG